MNCVSKGIILRPSQATSTTSTHHNNEYTIHPPQLSNTNPKMTKSHSVLALCLCYTSFILVVCISSQLIGFIFGPSARNYASVEQQLLFDKLPAINNQDIYIAETAALVLEQYKMAYTEERALVSRDAGIISALLAMILVMFPNFTSTSYSNSQRLSFLLLILPLYLLPGLLGQMLFQKSIPIEILLIEKSPLSGLTYIAYCSAKSLLVGMGGSLSTFSTIMHELKVVISSVILVFVTLG